MIGRLHPWHPASTVRTAVAANASGIGPPQRMRVSSLIVLLHPSRTTPEEQWRGADQADRDCDVRPRRRAGRRGTGPGASSRPTHPCRRTFPKIACPSRTPVRSER
jgi:hypothetical protein